MATLKCAKCEKTMEKAQFDPEEIAKQDAARCKGCVLEDEAAARANRNGGGDNGGGLEDNDLNILVKDVATHLFAWDDTGKWHLCKYVLTTVDHTYLKIWADENEILSTMKFTADQIKLRLKPLTDDNKDNAFN